MIRVTVRQYE